MEEIQSKRNRAGWMKTNDDLRSSPKSIRANAFCRLCQRKYGFVTCHASVCVEKASLLYSGKLIMFVGVYVLYYHVSDTAQFVEAMTNMCLTISVFFISGWQEWSTLWTLAGGVVCVLTRSAALTDVDGDSPTGFR